MWSLNNNTIKNILLQLYISHCRFLQSYEIWRQLELYDQTFPSLLTIAYSINYYHKKRHELTMMDTGENVKEHAVTVPKLLATCKTGNMCPLGGLISLKEIVAECTKFYALSVNVMHQTPSDKSRLKHKDAQKPHI